MNPRQIVIADEAVTLTRRQIDVARCAADGFDVAGTAAMLGIGCETVKRHRSLLLQRIGAINITAACVLLVRRGML